MSIPLELFLPTGDVTFGEAEPPLDLFLAHASRGPIGPQGPQGVQGFQGVAGPQGVQGVQGSPGDLGPIGPLGPQGVQGVSGSQGSQGVTGYQGFQGSSGVQGAQGSAGVQGQAGAIGPSVLVFRGPWSAGTSYVTNDWAIYNELSYVALASNTAAPPDSSPASWSLLYFNAPAGAQGAQGVAGPPGPLGNQGVQGGAGEEGPVGPQGVTGAASTVPGPQGDTGVQGPVGVQGGLGAQGAQGVIGVTGAQGAQGPAGSQGFSGQDGISGNQGSQGVQGPAGVSGLNYRGQYSNTTAYLPRDLVNYLGSGYVNQLASTGVPPTAGGNNANWNILVLQGAPGAQGAQGNAGPQGAQGAQGVTGVGVQGSQGVSGTQGSQGLRGFQGFQGPTGVQGVQGAKGAQGFQGVVGAQGNQGKLGAVGPQGPRGFQGDAGPAGAQGPQGVQGARGLQGVAGAAGGRFVIQSTKPTAPLAGDVWWDSDDGQPYIYYDDGNSSQWVSFTGSPGAQGVVGAQGVQGVTGAQGNQGTQGTQGAGSAAGGATTQVQYNNAGAFAGNAGLTFDAANARLMLGTGVTTAGNDFYLQKTVNGSVGVVAQNLSTGTAGQCVIAAVNSANVIELIKYSTGFTTSGLLAADSGLLYNSTGQTEFVNAAAQPFIFGIGGIAAANEVFRLYAPSNGDFRAQLTGLGANVAGQRGVVMGINNTYLNGYQGVTIMVNGTAGGSVHTTGSGYTGASGLFGSDGMFIYAGTGAVGGIWLGNSSSTGFVSMFSGGTATGNERFRMLSGGNVIYQADGVAMTTSTESAIFRASRNSRHGVVVDNTFNGSGAYAGFSVFLNSVPATDFTATPASWAASGIFGANQSNWNAMLSGGLNIVTAHASGVMRFATGGTAANNERMRIEANGDIKYFNAGAQQFHWDMTNARFNFGTAVTTSGNDFYFKKDQAATTSLFVQNSNTAVNARASMGAFNSTDGIGFYKYSTLYTPNGLESAALGLIYTGTGPMVICSGAASAPLIFATSGLGSANERMRIDTNGNIGICAAGGGGVFTVGAAVHLKNSQNAQMGFWCENPSTGTAAYAAYFAMNSNGPGDNAGLYKFGGSFTTSGIMQANDSMLVNNAGAGNRGRLLLVNSQVNDMVFAVGGTAATNEVMRITSTGPTLSIGHTAGSTVNLLWAKRSFNGQNAIIVENSSATAAAYAAFYAINNSAHNTGMFKTSSAYTTAGLVVAEMSGFQGGDAPMLVFTSTAHDIIFATGGSATTNENARFKSGGGLAIGTTTLAGLLSVQTSVAQTTLATFKNTTVAANAYALLQVVNDGANYLGLVKLSSGYTTAGLIGPNTNVMQSTGGDMVICTLSSNPIVFSVNGNGSANEALRIDALGNVSVGSAALATTATDGFFYLPTCAGPPTGVPSAKTGRVAHIYDTTNNNLYVYTGGWKKVLLS